MHGIEVDCDCGGTLVEDREHSRVAACDDCGRTYRVTAVPVPQDDAYGQMT